MYKNFSVTVHTRLGPDSASRPRLEPRSVESLVQPRLEPATSYSISPWSKQHPPVPTPNSHAFTTTAPPPIKVPRARSRSPSPTDWDLLPEFAHYARPPTPLRALPKRDSGMQSKYTTDRRPAAGAWRASEAQATNINAGVGEGNDERKDKKRVRVETPATTANKRTAVSGSEGGASPTRRKSSRKVEAPVVEDRSTRRSPRTRKATSAKELVPATPEENVLKAATLERGDLATGAIERCIPQPYHHIVHHDHPPMDYPKRQKTARVLHSFVDPSYSASSSTSSASVMPGAISELSSLSPKTSQFLVPGRQGSWLIPISGPFPIAHTSPPLWYSLPPPPTSPHTSKTTSRLQQKVEVRPIPIEWTSSRLVALWSFLTDLNESSAWGPLRATCHLPPRPSSSSSSSAAETSSTSLPGYVKVTIDANLALGFRTWLSLISVSTAPDGTAFPSKADGPNGGPLVVKEGGKHGKVVKRGQQLREQEVNVENGSKGEEGRGGRGGERASETKFDRKDGERWLKGRTLVWVDESGRAILLA